MRTSPFTVRVLDAVRRIPPGRVATYGDIARLAGRPGAWRAVGTVMAACRDAGVPCHRVVAASGGLGGYGGETALKRALLRAEGVIVVGTRIRRWREVRVSFAPVKPVAGNPTASRAVSTGRHR